MDVSLYAKAGGQCFPGQLGTGSNRRAGQCVAQTEAVLESTRSPLPLHWTGRNRTNEASLLRMIVLGTRGQRDRYLWDNTQMNICPPHCRADAKPGTGLTLDPARSRQEQGEAFGVPLGSTWRTFHRRVALTSLCSPC